MATYTTDYSQYTTVYDGQDFGSTPLVISGKTNVLVRNCTWTMADNNNGAAIVITNSSNVWIEDNTIEGTTDNTRGIYISPGDSNTVTIHRNVIRDTGSSGITSWQNKNGTTGAYVSDNDGLKIVNNFFSGCGRAGTTGDRHSIYVQSREVFIEGNLIEDSLDGSGIRVESSGYVHNNIVRRCARNGISYQNVQWPGPSSTVRIEWNKIEQSGLEVTTNTNSIHLQDVLDNNSGDPCLQYFIRYNTCDRGITVNSTYANYPTIQVVQSTNNVNGTTLYTIPPYVGGGSLPTTPPPLPPSPPAGTTITPPNGSVLYLSQDFTDNRTPFAGGAGATVTTESGQLKVWSLDGWKQAEAYFTGLTPNALIVVNGKWRSDAGAGGCSVVAWKTGGNLATTENLVAPGSLQNWSMQFYVPPDGSFGLSLFNTTANVSSYYDDITIHVGPVSTTTPPPTTPPPTTPPPTTPPTSPPPPPTTTTTILDKTFQDGVMAPLALRVGGNATATINAGGELQITSPVGWVPVEAFFTGLTPGATGTVTGAWRHGAGGGCNVSLYDPVNDTNLLVPELETFSSTSWATFSRTFTVPANGQLGIGLHSTTPNILSYFDNIKIVVQGSIGGSAPPPTSPPPPPPPPTYTTTYYVDPVGGNDLANGTSESTPWKTMTKVNATTLSAGAGLLFKRGTSVTGPLTIPSSGTSSNPITYGAYGTGADPVITGGTNTVNYNAKNWIVVRDLNIQASTGSGGVVIGWTGNKIMNCTVANHAAIGIIISGTSDQTTIQNCIIENNGEYGICHFARNNTNQIIDGNMIRNNGTKSGVVSSGWNGYIQSGEIRNNVIFNNGLNGTNGQSHGLYHGDLQTTSTLKIYNNVISGNVRGAGILAKSTTEIYNNTITGNGAAGISCGQNGTNAVTFNIHDNLITATQTDGVLCAQKGTGNLTLILDNNTIVDSGSNGINVGSTLTALTMTDNIIRGASTFRSATSQTSFTCNYNLHYNPSGSVALSLGGTSFTWTSWRSAGRDTNGLNVDPLFNGANDYRLRSTSPAVTASSTGSYMGSAGVVSTTSTPPTVPVSIPASAGTGKQWKLVFDEEFGGSSINTSVWTDLNLTFADAGHGYLAGNRLEWNSFNNVSLSNGNLVLTARREAYTSLAGQNYTWTSGLLTSKVFKFQSGYVEARIRMPSSSGFWPAFWVCQAPGVSGTQQADIVEFFSNDKTKTYHKERFGTATNLTVTPSADPSLDFHIYGINIQPEGITWYVDGVQVGTAAGASADFMNIVLNLSVYSVTPPATGTNSATMLVDWVRAYSSDPDAVEAVPQVGYPSGTTSPPVTVWPYQTPTTVNHIYVATTGNDTTGNGTQALPYRTIGKAATLATAGTTVHVANGTYAENVTATFHGTATNPIVYVSDSRFGAKIVPPTTSPNNIAFDSRGNFTHVVGFEIDGTNHVGGTRWRNGIVASGSDSRIAYNWVHHLSQDGGLTTQAAAIHAKGAPYSGGPSGGATNIAIDGNIVHNICPTGQTSIDNQGIWHSTSGQIVNNLVYACAGNCINLWNDPRDLLISNNTVFNGRVGILVAAGANANQPSGSPATRITVQNNIVYDLNSVGITEGGAIGTNTYRNNLVYWSPTNMTLLNGNTATGTISNHPAFVSFNRAGGGDYKLSATSPCINSGTAISVPTIDLAGTARPVGTGYDIGAYEYVPSGTNPPPTTPPPGNPPPTNPPPTSPPPSPNADNSPYILPTEPPGSASGTVFLANFDSAVDDDEADLRGQPLQVVGSVTMSRSRNRAGGASILFPGGSGNYLTMPDSAVWDLGSGNFVIQAIVEFHVNGFQPICGQAGDTETNTSWLLCKNATNQLEFKYNIAGSLLTMTGATTLLRGVRYTLAVVRSSGNLYGFVNTSRDVAASISGTVNTSSRVFSVGHYEGTAFPNSDLAGKLYGLRLKRNTDLGMTGTTTPLITSFPIRG